MNWLNKTEEELDVNEQESVIPFSRDEVIVNLKILSDVQVHDKLKITNKYLCKDNSYRIVQTVLRKVSGDSRGKILNFLNSLVEKAFDYLDEDMESKGKYCNTQQFLADLKGSVKGLLNLKTTYSGHHPTMYRLQLLVEKIEAFINESNLQIQSRISH
jgi:hypothetical protein